VHPVGTFTGRPVVTETFVRDVVADGRTGSTWPSQLPKRIVPPAGFLSNPDVLAFIRRRIEPGGSPACHAVAISRKPAQNPGVVGIAARC
jgi:hypothetical protein